MSSSLNLSQPASNKSRIYGTERPFSRQTRFNSALTTGRSCHGCFAQLDCATVWRRCVSESTGQYWLHRCTSIGASFPPFQNFSKIIQSSRHVVVLDVRRHIPARRAPGPTHRSKPDAWHFAGVGKMGRTCVTGDESGSRVISPQQIKNPMRPHRPQIDHVKIFAELIQNWKQLRLIPERRRNPREIVEQQWLFAECRWPQA